MFRKIVVSSTTGGKRRSPILFGQTVQFLVTVLLWRWRQ